MEDAHAAPCHSGGNYVHSCFSIRYEAVLPFELAHLYFRFHDAWCHEEVHIPAIQMTACCELVSLMLKLYHSKLKGIQWPNSSNVLLAFTSFAAFASLMK